MKLSWLLFALGVLFAVFSKGIDRAARENRWIGYGLRLLMVVLGAVCIALVYRATV